MMGAAMYEAWPDDPRQTPHPDSAEWHDPEWRDTWLLGLHDETLTNLSPFEKGSVLPAYVYRNGYEVYGQAAADQILGSQIWAAVGLDVGLQPWALGRLGAVIREHLEGKGLA
jgi:hypothetical protein